MRTHLIEDEGVNGNNTHLCYNGLDPSKYHHGPRVRTQALSNASLVIGTLSVLRAEKSIETLIEAFAQILPADPKMRLAIVGSGPQLEDLRSKAARLNITGACHFEPTTTEPEKWLASMDIFVLPSLSEAFSNSLMEAMASACAVVATCVGGNPELIDEGQSGLLFEPASTVQLNNCLRLLISNHDLRHRLTARSIEKARSLTIEASAAQLSDIYTFLLNK